MRFLSLMMVVTALTACSAQPGNETPVTAGETRQQTCQPGTNPNQNDCGHFPEPEFH